MTQPDHAALSLVCRVRMPAVAATGHPPLLLLLHGVGSNELAMAALASDFDPRFVVLSVRSPVQLGPFSYGWYPVDFTPDGPVIDADEARAAWERLTAFVGEAVTAFDTDPDQVFVAGFSQGGILALATMLTAPELLAGAVCMSGRLPPEVVPFAVARDRLRDKPVLVVHGTGDRTLDVEYGRRAVETLRTFSLEVETREFDLGHTTSPESVAFVSAWLAARLRP